MGFVIFISVIHIFVGIKTQETLSVHKKLEIKHKSTSLFCRKTEAEAAFQTKPVFCFFFSKE